MSNEADRRGDKPHWSQFSNANLIHDMMVMMTILPPLVVMPSALHPAGLLFYVVFITKSNILLCLPCHPSL